MGRCYYEKMYHEDMFVSNLCQYIQIPIINNAIPINIRRGKITDRIQV